MTAARSRIPSLLAVGFIALVVAVGLRWFFENFERRAVEYRAGYGEPARQNPLLALERYLGQAGYEVVTADRLDALLERLGRTDAAILVTRGLNLAPAQLARLEAWLEGGAYLVAAPGQFWVEDLERSGDRFFDELGVRLLELSRDTMPTLSLAGTTAVTVAAAAAPLEVAFQADRVLVDGAGKAIAGSTAGAIDDQSERRAYHLLDYAVGAGRVTVASDLRFLRNQAIGEHDHAWLAQVLLAPAQPTRVMLIHGRGIPSLPEILWREAGLFILSLTALGFAALWYRAARFGPLVDEQASARRDLREGLAAGQRFLWAHQARAAVLRGSRENLERSWSRRLPRAARAGPETLAAAIAGQAGITISEVRRALFDPIEDETTLLAATRTLQQLDLHDDGRN